MLDVSWRRRRLYLATKFNKRWNTILSVVFDQTKTIFGIAPFSSRESASQSKNRTNLRHRDLVDEIKPPSSLHRLIISTHPISSAQSDGTLCEDIYHVLLSGLGMPYYQQPRPTPRASIRFDWTMGRTSVFVLCSIEIPTTPQSIPLIYGQQAFSKRTTDIQYHWRHSKLETLRVLQMLGSPREQTRELCCSDRLIPIPWPHHRESGGAFKFRGSIYVALINLSSICKRLRWWWQLPLLMAIASRIIKMIRKSPLKSPVPDPSRRRQLEPHRSS